MNCDEADPAKPAGSGFASVLALTTSQDSSLEQPQTELPGAVPKKKNCSLGVECNMFRSYPVAFATSAQWQFGKGLAPQRSGDDGRLTPIDTGCVPTEYLRRVHIGQAEVANARQH